MSTSSATEVDEARVDEEWSQQLSECSLLSIPDEIADLVAEGSGADELSSAASNKIRDTRRAREVPDPMLKEVRVAMTVQSGNAEPWQHCPPPASAHRIRRMAAQMLLQRCAQLVCPLVLDILDLDCKGERQSLAARYNTQASNWPWLSEISTAAKLALNRGDYLAFSGATTSRVNVDSPTWWEGKIVPREEFETGNSSCSRTSSLTPCSLAASADGGGGTRSSAAKDRILPRLTACALLEPGKNSGELVQTDSARPADGDAKQEKKSKEQQEKLESSTSHQQQEQQQQTNSSATSSARIWPATWGENNLDYPSVLIYCVSLIESHGAYHEGLYRKSGNGTEVQRLMQKTGAPASWPHRRRQLPLLWGIRIRGQEARTALDSTDSAVEPESPATSNGESPQAVRKNPSDASEEESKTDEADSNPVPMCPYRMAIHNYTNLLKLYFRELPVPLLAEQFSDCPPEIGQLRDCVAQMSPVHLRVAKYLFSHLHRIASHSNATLMTSHNLAIVWAPNLCQHPAIGSSTSGIVEAAKRSQHQANMVACLIDNCDELFLLPRLITPLIIVCWMLSYLCRSGLLVPKLSVRRAIKRDTAGPVAAVPFVV
uniref:Rho-GAP domain-containing protein n=1 Tax=Macrostomum lignano TaxID=282301 RepID=A0A1I8FKX9_9PLAT